jgi:NitT/TauT family transport system substrate-binding protein
MSSDDINIKNQSPPVGAANIAKGRIDAHADFCPWSEIMEFRGTGRKIYDGSETGVPYLHGVVVRQDYAEKYPEIVVAMAKAIVEAGDWVREDPMRAAESLEKWTGVEKEVQYLYFSNGGHLTLDPTIKEKWVEALAYDHSVLETEKSIPPLDVKAWIDDSYVKQAYKELGLDYAAEVAHINDPKQSNPELPAAELWHAAKGIETFDTVKEMLVAMAEYSETGQKINATYVYDKVTALKLFGNVAIYVESDDGQLTAFMRKPDADKFAADGGTVMEYDAALASVATKDDMGVASN